MILVKLTPTDKQWTARAIRAVHEDAEAQGRYVPLLGNTAGYAGPMSHDQADDLAQLLMQARPCGGQKWLAAMERVAGKLEAERFEAVRRDSGSWAAGLRAARREAELKARCTECANMIVGQWMGKAVDWFCPNCGRTVIAEGEA
jgi:predicted RNA-binding Zn-ribbon protein involved in translation (DUF1610 family)